MSITLRVLDGADRGKIYGDLPLPITIGREEGNSIQLNDERISRFHIKIQEDNSKFILTDLESTNGTKVNGDEIRLRILRYGDLVRLGRSLLLFGSEEQIAARLAEIRSSDDRSDVTLAPEEHASPGSAASLDYELNWNSDPAIQGTLHSLQQPDLPEEMTPCQAAQLSELLEYMHLRIGDLLATAHPADEESERMTLEQRQWQNLLDLQARLSDYMRRITEPPELG